VDQDKCQWSVSGIDTRVYDSGSRYGERTIVLVHGGDPRSLANAYDWGTVWAPDLLRSRLVAYDKPGQGHTYARDMSPDAMSAPGLSEHLIALIDRIGAEDVILVGHSRGALPVADVALRIPRRVAGVVLVASNTLAPPSSKTPTDFYWRAYAEPPATPAEEFVRREPEMNSHNIDHVTSTFIDRRVQAALANDWWNDIDHRLAVYGKVVEPSLQQMRASVLRRISKNGFTMPVLQVWGREDTSAPLVLNRRLYEVISRKSAEAWQLVLNGAAHYVYRERPRQFLAVLRGFIESL
jgi:pimeloyl-ACP methyl ester carboxylesterase